jgi:hypothetical protein
MADIALVYRPDGVTIDAVRLDASLSETHSHEAEITEHPVDDGVNVSDHIRQKPDVLTIEGIFTNTQLSRDGITRAVETGGVIFETSVFDEESSVAGTVGYAEASYRKLVEAKEAGKLMSVVTGLRSYDSMAIQSISAPRNANIGDAVQFTIVLRHFRVVTSRTTKVEVREPRAKGKTKLGRQTAPAASDQAKAGGKKSMLIGGIQSVGLGSALDRYLPSGG